jgi:hypothetical protein
MWCPIQKKYLIIHQNYPPTNIISKRKAPSDENEVVDVRYSNLCIACSIADFTQDTVYFRINFAKFNIHLRNQVS